MKLSYLFIAKIFVMNNFSICTSNRIQIDSEYSTNLGNYISSLVRTETEKDCSRNHLVTFIRFEDGNQSEIFEDVISEVSKSSTNNPVFIHSLS